MTQTVVKRVVVPAVAEHALDSAWDRVTSSYGIERVRAPWLSVSTTEKEDDSDEEVSAIMVWPERADEVLMLLKEARPHEEPEDRRALSTAGRRVAKATGVADPIDIDSFLSRYAANIGDGFGARPVIEQAAPRRPQRRPSGPSGAEIAAQVNAMKRGELQVEARPMPRWLFNIIVVVCFTGVGVAGLFVVVRCAT